MKILQFFTYEHLPEKLQAVSKPFCDLARAIVGDERGMPEGTSIQFPLPDNRERSKALDKLLEAKDAAVRAALMEPDTTIVYGDAFAGASPRTREEQARAIVAAVKDPTP